MRSTRRSLLPCLARFSLGCFASSATARGAREAGQPRQPGKRFRARGRYSSATVRGTDWTVTDRCDGTLTTVRRGRVAVRDFKRRKNVSVRAGKSYLARAKRARR